MKRTKILMVLFLMFLLIPAVAYAADGFTNANLKGDYYVGQLGVDTSGADCMLLKVTFDGAGSFTYNGTLSDTSAADQSQSGSGTYSVNADGTFTILNSGDSTPDQGRLSWDARTFIMSRLDNTDRHTIFVGVRAMPNGFPKNTFYGYYAGRINTAEYNTFLGYATGYNNGTGTSNTFLGYGAGLSNTTGNSNTFLGANAGYTNTEGSNNNFVGTSTGFYNISGIKNTFQGNLAGNKNTTGSRNSYFGNSAGYSNTIGNGNIFIGFKAGYYETGSDKLYIDNSDTATPLIYGDFAANTVTINGTLTGELVDTSSREYKDNIQELQAADAMVTLQGLNPVTFNFKRSPQEQKVGFIAEDVPELVATNDRKGLSSMDIVAVLTKAVQEQQKNIQEQQKINAELREELNNLKAKLK
jgi:hypothetical protein